MLFNSNHNSFTGINAENYEAYFLLYIDDELDAGERVAVENFLLANPHLQQVMASLQGVKLPVEDIHLDNKKSLLTESMEAKHNSEQLLLFIDSELNAVEKKGMEEKLKQNSLLRHEYELLLRTRSDASELVAYPYKNELYRNKVRSIPVVYWLRIAVVFLIVLAATIFVYYRQPHANITVFISPGKRHDRVQQPLVHRENSIAQTSSEQINTEVKFSESVKKTKLMAKKKTRSSYIHPTSEGTPLATENNEQVANTQRQPLEIIAATPANENSPKQSINNSIVTLVATPSYHNQETSSLTAVSRDVLTQAGNEKKSSIKGLLRKATRFIEHHTNISPTNENNELLVGAMSFQL